MPPGLLRSWGYPPGECSSAAGESPPEGRVRRSAAWQRRLRLRPGMPSGSHSPSRRRACWTLRHPPQGRRHRRRLSRCCRCDAASPSLGAAKRTKARRPALQMGFGVVRVGVRGWGWGWLARQECQEAGAQQRCGCPLAGPTPTGSASRCLTHSASNAASDSADRCGRRGGVHNGRRRRRLPQCAAGRAGRGPWRG